MRDQLS